eukprot:scaffold22195_cov38-Prasinocladus_malaysianus.AAC.2
MTFVVFVYHPSAESTIHRCLASRAAYEDYEEPRNSGLRFARPVGSPYRQVRVPEGSNKIFRTAGSPTTFQAEFSWPAACVLVVSIYVFVYHTSKKTTAKSLLAVLDLIDDMFSCYSYTGVSDKNASSRGWIITQLTIQSAMNSVSNCSRQKFQAVSSERQSLQ